MVKAFKTKDIQYTNRMFMSNILFINGRVNLLYDPDEHSAVYTLYKRIPDILWGVNIHGNRDYLTLGHDRSGCQGIN